MDTKNKAIETKYKAKETVQGFVGFIRKQGVVGLAVGFVLGGSISKLVSAAVEDIVNPLVGIILKNKEGLQTATIHIANANIKIGHFISVLLDFVIIAGVIYFVIKGLGFDRLDKKEDK